MEAGTAGGAAVWIGLIVILKLKHFFPFFFFNYRLIIFWIKGDKKGKNTQLPISFGYKKELSFCCHFILKWKQNEQSWQTKLESISKATYAEVHSSLFWNYLERLTQTQLISTYSLTWSASFQGSKHTYFLN